MLPNEPRVLQKVKRVAIAVESVDFHDEEFEQDFHLELVLDNDVKVATFELYGEALPGEERHQLVDLLLAAVLRNNFIDRVLKHLEPC